MDLELDKEIAVIAGGARGIGRSIAQAFAAEGADIVILDLLENVESIATEIAREAGRDVRALGCRCDMTRAEDVEHAKEKIFAALGGWQHVVVAAAIGSGKFGYPFSRLDPEDWRRVLEVNVEGAVRIAHAFVPHLFETGRGTVTFIGSVAAQFGSQTDPPYSASKAALLNFAQCVARDAAPYGVRVNSICPGMVRTELNRSVWKAWADGQGSAEKPNYEAWADEKVKRVVPLGRWQDPEDVANMAVFLASRCARNVTGQTVNVDGGYVMR